MERNWAECVLCWDCLFFKRGLAFISNIHFKTFATLHSHLRNSKTLLRRVRRVRRVKMCENCSHTSKICKMWSIITLWQTWLTAYCNILSQWTLFASLPTLCLKNHEMKPDLWIFLSFFSIQFSMKINSSTASWCGLIHILYNELSLSPNNRLIIIF